MSEHSKFFNSVGADVRTYSAEDFAEYYSMFYGKGIIKTTKYTDSLAASVYNDSNTTILIKPGVAIIEGYQYINDDDLLINVSGTGYIVLRLNLTERTIKAMAVTAPNNIANDDIVDSVLAYYETVNGKLTVKTSGYANYSKALFTYDYEAHKQSNDEAHKSLSARMSSAEIALGANALLKTISSVDGSGSGLDADKLDGKEGSYFLDYNNFNNTPIIHSGTQEPTPDIGKDGELYILYEESN